MAMTFYTNPMSRGRMARWALEETGQPYDEVIVPFGPPMKAPDYTSVNPMGKVPALVHDGGTVTEVAAIVTWLADTFPASGLMPADRGAFYRWMFFGAGPLEYAVTNASMGFEVPPDQRGRMGYGSLDRVVRTLTAHPADRPFLCGEAFSGADLYLGSQIGFAMERGGLPGNDTLRDWAGRSRDRPAAAAAAAKDNALMGGGPHG